MKWTPDEAAKLLAERTHQPHYIKWVLEQCVKEAMEQASRAVVPSVAVPEGWKPEGPVTADHPLKCLIVLPALRQSDGDWFSHGTFVCEGEVLAWRPDTPEGRAALHDPRIDSAAAPAPQPGAEGLAAAVEAHIIDLRACVRVIRESEFAETLESTAAEFDKAANELAEALAAALAQQSPK